MPIYYRLLVTRNVSSVFLVTETFHSHRSSTGNDIIHSIPILSDCRSVTVLHQRYWFNIFFKFFILCVRVFGLHVWLYITCIPDVWRGQRRHKASWNWSYKQLWTTVWVWKLNPGPLEKKANVLNHWVIFLLLPHFYF